MNCRNLEELLSAYADGELSRTQREFIEEHLSVCADCRETLAEFVQAGRRLTSLRGLPEAPDIRGATISRVKAVGRFSGRPYVQWLRPAIIGLAAVAVLVIAFVQPWSASEEPKAVLARTQEAVADIQYYRSVSFITITAEGQTSSSQMEVDFATPDRYRISITGDGQAEEFIIIGETQYVTNDAFGWVTIKVFPDNYSSILKKEATLELLDELTGVEKLPEEEIEGIRCLHYIGRLDMEKRIEEMKSAIRESNAESDIPAISDEQMEEIAEGMRSIDVSYELWIGKDDYLLRQMKVEQTVPGGDDGEDMFASMVMRYSDFNQPIVIEPPLDAGGQLLDGWRLVESIETNEQVFGKSITGSAGTQEGYDDWAHQEMKYTITITNNSNQTVKDVRVTISTKLIDELNIPLVVAEPEIPADIVDPGGSRTFHACIPFDATGYTKEDILELQEMKAIFVDYTTEDGQERTQLIYPDGTYPSTVPPPATPDEEDT
ncbi:MAG: zf-HC2 domain-containing protein [Dehalococcoidia bacterium]|jgi:outer membrane lipoprotein-sorting protein